MLPILDMWDVSDRYTSHDWEVARKILSLKNKFADLSKLSCKFSNLLITGISMFSSLFSAKNILEINTFDGNRW